MSYARGMRGYRGIGEVVYNLPTPIPVPLVLVNSSSGVDPDEAAATARLYSLPVVYNLPGIGRIVDGGGYWYGLDTRGPNMGSTVSPDVMLAHGLPATPGAKPPALVRTTPMEIAVGQATDPSSQGWNATVAQNTWDAFVAELKKEHDAGIVSDAGYQHALTLEDAGTAAAAAKGYDLPPGGGDVLKAADASYTNESGDLHPDAQKQVDSGYAAQVVQYTAQQQGSTPEVVARRVLPAAVADQVLAQIAAPSSSAAAALKDPKFWFAAVPLLFFAWPKIKHVIR